MINKVYLCCWPACPPRLRLLNRCGGLAIDGYPISEAFYEVNQADGRRYEVVRPGGWIQ